MKRDIFNQAGSALYGTNWKTDLGHAFGHAGPRLIRAWANGERPMPSWVKTKVAALIDARIKQLQRLRDRLNR